MPAGAPYKNRHLPSTDGQLTGGPSEQAMAAALGSPGQPAALKGKNISLTGNQFVGNSLTPIYDLAQPHGSATDAQGANANVRPSRPRTGRGI